MSMALERGRLGLDRFRFNLRRELRSTGLTRAGFRFSSKRLAGRAEIIPSRTEQSTSPSRIGIKEPADDVGHRLRPRVLKDREMVAGDFEHLDFSCEVTPA